MSGGDEHDGATIQEQLIEACRRNNVDLLNDLLEDKPDNEISKLLNETKTVMGNYLYHEAASYGNYEIIDNLLDQPEFECDPINRRDGDTPLHSAIRWINSEPPAQRPFGNALVEMMLEAGSSTRVKNKARLTPYQLVDPTNKELREIIQKHEYANQNAGDFINVNSSAGHSGAVLDVPDDSDDDAEFSGSDEEERAEWERRRKEKQRK